MVQFKHSNLESAAEAAGGGGKAFTAGTLGQLPPSPRISFDGTTLWLDAARLDAVGGMIIDSRYCLDYHKLLGLDPLLRLLRNVAGMTQVYPLGDGTSFDAVTTALASSLSSSSDKDTNFLMDEGPDQSPLLLPPEKRARIWLCEFIDREVRHWATYLQSSREIH